MTKTAISIIIPAYRAEGYIRQCLDSLIHQDFDLPYQVILVECDSPDKTGEICKEYEQERPDLFYYFHYDFNHGVSVGRNLGLLHAVGEYVTFLDSDDYIDSRFLSQLYRCAKETKSQVVTCGYYLFSGDKKKKAYSRLYYKGTGKEALTKFYRSPKMKIRTYCWGRLYDRQLLIKHRIQFDVKARRFEDWIFFCKVLLHADKVIFFKAPLYHYRQHEGSLMARATDILSPHLYAIKKSKHDIFVSDYKLGEKIFHKPTMMMKMHLWYDANHSYQAMKLSKRDARKYAKKELKKIFDGRM